MSQMQRAMDDLRSSVLNLHSPTPTTPLGQVEVDMIEVHIMYKAKVIIISQEDSSGLRIPIKPPTLNERDIRLMTEQQVKDVLAQSCKHTFFLKGRPYPKVFIAMRLYFIDFNEQYSRHDILFVHRLTQQLYMDI